MHNHSYDNEFNLHVNEISFSYEKMGTKTRFEEEAKGNSEMAYWQSLPWSQRFFLIFPRKREPQSGFSALSRGEKSRKNLWDQGRQSSAVT